MMRSTGAALAAPHPLDVSWTAILDVMIAPVSEQRQSTVDRSEQLAIERVKAGDPQSFDFLVQRYMRKALSIAWGIVRDRAEAEDITQDALVKAYRNIRSMRTSEAFAPWLFRIVTNLALDRLRSMKRRPTDALPESLHAKERADATPSEAMAARIDRAIEALPEKQRLAARLYLVEELSHAEIATILDMKEVSVRANLSHARRKLQEELRDVYEDLS